MRNIKALLALAVLLCASPALAVDYVACVVSGVVKICPADARLKTSYKIGAAYLDLSGLASVYVALTGDQTIAGVKTFSSPPVLSLASAQTGTLAPAALSAPVTEALGGFGANISGIGNGMLARTGANTYGARTITGGTDIDVSNGDGSGNPTISITAAKRLPSPINGYIPVGNGTTWGFLPTTGGIMYSVGATPSWITAVPVANGGTGLQSFASAGELLYSNSTTALLSLAAGTSGYLLKSNGAAAPSWLNLVPVTNGGTGQTAALVAGGLLYGASTTAQGVTAAGTTGYFATSGGTGAPTWGPPPIGIISTGFRGSTTGSTTYYFTGQGNAPSTGGDQVFYQAPRAVTVKNCSCYAGFGGSGTGTCTLRKWDSATWSNTALTCTMTLPDYRCQDTTHSATFATSDLASGKAATSAGVTLNTDTEAHFSCEVYAQ